MIARNVDYNFPEVGYLILAGFVWFALFYALNLHRKKQISSLASPELLSTILIPRSNFYYWIKVASFILAWVFACVAFMEPKADARYIHTGSEQSGNRENQQPPRTILIAMDASASMSVQDARLGLTRFDDGKELAQAIASLFTGSNIGVYAFTSIPTLLSPPTPDQLFVQLMIKMMLINAGDIPGTDYLELFKSIQTRFLKDPSDMQYILVLISDGGDTAWEYAQGAAKDVRAKQILESLKPAHGVKFKAFTIGEGSLQGDNIPNISYKGHPVASRLENGLLEQISQEGHGKSFTASQYSTLILADELKKAILQIPYEPNVIAPATEKTREESLVYDLYFQYPLALALFFLGLALFLPDTTFLKTRKMDD